MQEITVEPKARLDLRGGIKPHHLALLLRNGTLIYGVKTRKPSRALRAQRDTSRP
jgi:hypothetical protein